MLTPSDYSDIVNNELTDEKWAKIVNTAIEQAQAGDKDARNWLCNFSSVTGPSHDHSCNICDECAAAECDDSDEDDYLSHGYSTEN